MRPRTEALAALFGLATIATVAALAGRSAGRPAETDRRPSTFLTGPDGSRALLEALQRIGIPVRRFRERPGGLTRLQDGSHQVLVVLNPTVSFSPPELAAVLDFVRTADLVAAGRRAEPLMRCFGYQVKPRFFDSVQVFPKGRAGPVSPDPWVGQVLVRTLERQAIDSSRMADWGPFACEIPPAREREELLITGSGEVAAVRLTLAEPARQVILVADEDLFRNRVLRESTAGPLVLSWVAGPYDRVVFEEYHHGFGASGSLAGAALGWSRRSPWGWAVWQLAAVGALALLFGAVRFGPVRAGITRTRRSSLEHVRALAVALSAARGHDEAIAALVRGLRRRLAPPGTRLRGEWRSWLEGLEGRATTPRARAALATLRKLTRPGQPASSVRLAANALEDLWQELQTAR